MAARALLVFAAYFPPHIGGYEIQTYELLRRLVKRDYNIDVVTCNVEGAPPEENMEGLVIYRLPSWNSLRGIYPIPKPTVTTFRVLLKLLSRRFDLVSTQTRFFPTSFLGLVFSKLKGLPLVHTERGTGHSIVPSRLIRHLGRIYDHTIGTIIVKSAKRNIGVSQAVCGFLRHLGAKNIVLVPNGIDSEVFRRVNTTLATDLGLEKAFVVTFVGRLIYAKGIQDLISIFPLITETCPKAKLLIVGSGPYRESLETLAGGNKNIIFLGKRTRDQTIEILSITNVFVNPSYSEGLPTSVLEAAAMGLPIVATDVGGTKEIIEMRKTGLLIGPQDPRGLATEILLLASSTSLARGLGKAARLKVIKDYSWEGSVEKDIKVHGEVL